MEKSFFFNAKVTDGVPDRVYSADELAQREACLISDGVLGARSLKVTGASAAGVFVISGGAMIRGYTYLNTSQMTLPIDAGDSYYDRIDTVALKLDLSARTINAVVLKGVPAPEPVPVKLKDTDTVKELPLADVYVERGSVPSVSNSHITDRRPIAGFASMREDILSEIKRYVGELDPVSSQEVNMLRRIIDILKDDGDGTAVLCDDGEYRDVPVVERVVAAEFDYPGTYYFAKADYPSEGDVYDIEVQGAGGGGGAYNGIARRGGGGGGGAFVSVSRVKLHRDECTVVVGAGGEGVPGGNGQDGGDSSFDVFTAEGGRGGRGGIFSEGGLGGVGMGRGGNGADGAPYEGNEIYIYCGRGGASAYGDGAFSIPGRVSSDGANAEHIGAGGSGGSCNTGEFDRKGGRGGDGYVTVYRYVRPSGEVQ